MQFWRNNLVVFQSFHEEFDVSFIFKGIGTDGAGDSTLSTALSFFCLLTAWEWTVIGFTHNYRSWRVVLQYIVLQKVSINCYTPDFKCSVLCVKIPREFTDWQLYKGSLNLYFSYVWLNLCLATLSRPFCSTIEFFTKFGPMPINVLQSRDRRATTLSEWYDRWAKKMLVRFTKRNSLLDFIEKSLQATIAKYGFPIRERTLLCQTLLMYLWTN